MTAQIIKREYEGSEMSFQRGDGWFNATAAAAKFGKRPVDWLNLTSTKEYIATLTEMFQSEKSSLWVKTVRGGKHPGTWMHPKLGVAFARWLDMRFAVWCDTQIDGILHGQVDQKKLRSEAASSFKVMSSVLQLVRDEQGKVTASHHYSNEARLINWALTGKFQGGIDRDSLPANELCILAKLEEKNAVLIGRGVSYDDRKKMLEQFALDLRAVDIVAVSQY